jgi:hypothetical protein
MSGISSIVLHCTLQYLPAVAVHEQLGCAHFFALSVAICLSSGGILHLEIPGGRCFPKNLQSGIPSALKDRNIPNVRLFK